MIHNPGHRIHQISSESNRAQKAVLHLQHRQLPARRSLKQPRFGTATPDHHSINTLGNPSPWGAKAQLTARQKAAQVALFPGGEAKGHTPPRLLRLKAPLQADRTHQGFDTTGLMALGVDAAAGSHQDGIHQGLQTGPLTSPDRGVASVMGQPPAAVKRHAKAVHWAPPKQSLKPHLGGDHIDRPCLLEQTCRMATVRTETHTGVSQIFGGEMAPGSPGDHIRMHLHHHRAVWMVLQSSLKHPLETAGIRQAKCDRSIPCRLIHHQHEGLLRRLRLPRGIHLAEPLLAPEPFQGACAVGLSHRDRRRNQLLDPTRGRCIEMHPQLIHQQSERWMLPALGHRAKQTVLEVPHRQIPLSSQSLDPQRTGSPPPGQQHVHIAAAARHQTVRCQQLRQCAMREHSPGRNPEPQSSRPGHRVRQVALNPHRWQSPVARWP